MRNRLLLLACATLLSGTVAGRADEQAAEARIRVEPDGFDFGRVLPQSTLRKQFTVRNVGEGRLVLDRPVTTCGCAAAILGETRLEPGRSTTLNVTLETRSARGPLEKRVLLPSNDSKQPRLEIKLKANVEPATR